MFTPLTSSVPPLIVTPPNRSPPVRLKVPVPVFVRLSPVPDITPVTVALPAPPIVSAWLAKSTLPPIDNVFPEATVHCWSALALIAALIVAD